jgi:hypothetical protein
MKIIYLFVICLLFLSNEVRRINCNSNTTCQKYKCNQLEEGTCIIKDDNGDIIIQRCVDQSQFCPFMKLSESSQVECVSRRGYHPRSFPGGICRSDDDCISGICVNSICLGKQLNEECKGHVECNYGLTCKKVSDTSYCQHQSKHGEVCDEDTDCVNTHGCNFGKCTPYLSLPDGSNINPNQRNLLPLCASGLYYDDKCVTMINIGENPNKCDDVQTCKYKLNDGNIVSIPEFCTCGKNSSGNKFCRLANGESDFVDYIENLKSMLQNIENCNTLERGVCMSSMRQSSELMQKFIISRVKALKYNELIEADDCVLNVFFPEIRGVNRLYNK